jgi:hypothetical protein
MKFMDEFLTSNVGVPKKNFGNISLRLGPDLMKSDQGVPQERPQTKIESVDFVEIFASIKSRKVSLYI